jgi:hypothetical protein
MAFRTLLARTLVALALIGLFSAPMLAPVPGAAATSAAAMADMPCCPPDTPSVPDCFETCPLLTVCLAKGFQNAGSAGSQVPMPDLASIILPVNDAVPTPLAQSPPARPPRSLS